MTKEQQDLIWKCLPKKAREEIKAIYYINLKDNRKYSESGVWNEASACSARFRLLENLYGKDNLISDTEPEEILMVERKKVQEMFDTGDRNSCATLAALFGDKCLPDKEEPKLKFNKGDKVKYKEDICEIIDIEVLDDFPYCIKNGSCTQWVAESDLEYYEQPKPKFKVGDKVRIKPNAKEFHQGYQNGYAWLDSRNQYVGKVYQVIEVCKDETIELDISEKFTYWSPIDLEPYTEENKETMEEKNRCEKCGANVQQCADPPCQNYPMEEKELNLCEILKGHEGETFYSPLYGNIKLRAIDNGYVYPLKFDCKGNPNFTTFSKCGKPNILAVECLVFPSKDQRDWNKWAEENNKPEIIKTPKTWSELVKDNKNYYLKYTYKGLDYNCSLVEYSPIEKAAVALLKIYYLIEVGYGGNVTKQDFDNLKEDDALYYIIYNHDVSKFIIYVCASCQRSIIMFHNKKQAEEFLSYPENVQLLRDYFML